MKGLSKVETLAVLLHGGVEESKLLRLPNVRRKDIETAKDILQQAFSAFCRELEEYVHSMKLKSQ